MTTPIRGTMTTSMNHVWTNQTGVYLWCATSSPVDTSQAGWSFPKQNNYIIQVRNSEESFVTADRSSQFQIIMTLHSLLGHRLSNALRVSSFKLPRQQVAEPSFQQRSHSTHEEQPHAPAGSPESTSRTFADWTLHRQNSPFTTH